MSLTASASLIIRVTLFEVQESSNNVTIKGGIVKPREYPSARVARTPNIMIGYTIMPANRTVIEAIAVIIVSVCSTMAMTALCTVNTGDSIIRDEKPTASMRGRSSSEVR